MKIEPEQSLFVLIDVQEKLFPHITNKEEIEKNLLILLEGLNLLEIPIIVNEQYKKGLGETIASIDAKIENASYFEKTTFSCCGEMSALDNIKTSGKKTIIIAGIETHVCVMQSVLDLLELNYNVVLVVDCVGSRKALDTDIAIERMVQAGVILATYESILFELTRDSKNSVFKKISQLVK